MKSKRMALMAIKYMPIIISGIMMMHIGLLMCGIDDKVAENFVTMQTLPTITMLLVSHAFGFCWIHKSFTLYNLLISLCMDYHREIGFDDTLMEHRLMAFTLGIVLFIILWQHLGMYKKCRCDYDTENVEQGTEGSGR